MSEGEANPVSFTIAHLSDLHLSPVTGFTPRHWNAKRALGFLNWQHKRRHIHQRRIVERIVADLHAHRPDHVAVTGDLVNLGLPAEYEAAAAWLATLGKPEHVSLVPGNHDIYTRLGRDPGIGRWQPFMRSDDWGRGIGAPADGFPYARKVGPVVIVGLCSAVETAPAIATGKVAPQQLAAALKLLQQAATPDALRLVLIHHPPAEGMTRPRHELIGAAEVSAALAASSADLVLHGHTHLPTHVRLPRPGREPLHLVGVASASAGVKRGHEPLAQYNLIEIRGGDGGRSVSLRRRGFERPDGGIVDLAHEHLT